MTRLIRPLRSGQITIPVEFRKKLGINEESLLQLTLADGELRIRPVHVAESKESSDWLKQLYERFAPVRAEAENMSEEEIDMAIMQAVRAVREEHA
jgi:AbrB family looped-hinge helix DNA binding protein